MGEPGIDGGVEFGKGEVIAVVGFPGPPETGVRLLWIVSTGASFQPSLESRFGGGGRTFACEGVLEIGGGGAGTGTCAVCNGA